MVDTLVLLDALVLLQAMLLDALVLLRMVLPVLVSVFAKVPFVALVQMRVVRRWRLGWLRWWCTVLA